MRPITMLELSPPSSSIATQYTLHASFNELCECALVFCVSYI